MNVPRDFARAEQLIAAMQKGDQLNEAAILRFAKGRSYEETVVGISALCAASVQLIAAQMKSAANAVLITKTHAAPPLSYNLEKQKGRSQRAALPFTPGGGKRGFADLPI